jgi:hypothetical protein
MIIFVDNPLKGLKGLFKDLLFAGIGIRTTKIEFKKSFDCFYSFVGRKPFFTKSYLATLLHPEGRSLWRQ